MTSGAPLPDLAYNYAVGPDLAIFMGVQTTVQVSQSRHLGFLINSVN